MIDDDDVTWVTMFMPTGGGPFGLLLAVAVIVFVWWRACSNDDECAKRHCDRGSPALMHHECLCVEKAR